jgi:recombinational DNA repair protein RecR
MRRLRHLLLGRRDQTTICVVEKPTDVFTLRRSSHRGVPCWAACLAIHGVTAERLHVAQLTARLQGGTVRELILGLGGSGEAETTELYLARLYAGRQHHAVGQATGRQRTEFIASSRWRRRCRSAEVRYRRPARG